MFWKRAEYFTVIRCEVIAEVLATILHPNILVCQDIYSSSSAMHSDVVLLNSLRSQNVQFVEKLKCTHLPIIFLLALE